MTGEDTGEDIDMTTDEALISALTPKQVGEITLQPFSVARTFIAADLSYPEPGICNWFITVWVCTLTEMEALKARENIAQARADAFKWAAAQGYSLNDYGPVRDAYIRLNQELNASAGARISEVGEDGQKKIEPGGRLGS